MKDYSFFKPSNKLEIKIGDESHFCTIYYVENEEITVFLDTGKDLPECEVEINIYAQDGIYNAKSRILSGNCLGEKVFYKLAFPTNIKHSQRREYLRADIETPFHLLIKDGGEKPVMVESITKNICAKGLCFVSDRLITSYSNLSVELLLDGRVIKTHAELVWSNPVRMENTFKFMTAVMFTDIVQDDMDYIAKQCRDFKPEEKAV